MVKDFYCLDLSCRGGIEEGSYDVAPVIGHINKLSAEKHLSS